MFKDTDGRKLILALEKDDMKLIISNAYFPNDHKLGIQFAEEMYLKILEFQYKFPDYQTIAGGDFNVCITSNDLLNRNYSTTEKNLADVINNNNMITNLKDSYRHKYKEGGYTWKRGTCYSRLDFIFVDSALVSKIASVKNDWAFDVSDHSTVEIKIKIESHPQLGPGIIKVNTRILEDPLVSQQIGRELEIMMSQTDQTWNPHSKLEFLKVAIRSIFSAKVAEIRKPINSEIQEIEEEVNQLEEFKITTIKALNNTVNINDSEIIIKINLAISKTKDKLQNLRNKLSSSQAFNFKAKWFEYREKSNKFFLGLMKSKQNKKLISQINNSSTKYIGQEEVSKGITEFYRNLYAPGKIEVFENDEFYKNCPKLTDDQAKSVDDELTINDLYKALKTCKDSSPGPDGIPYLIYKKYWNIVGPIILDAWKYTIDKQKLPPSHYESIITLLPKEGKDTTDIKNWRPITLSNCDSKIITKALSNKVSKVLDFIIDESQTAYVPGRSVADNLRSNFFMKKYCKNKKIESVLISLDAKKAFDSVEHK
jgi:hypothetical protein